MASILKVDKLDPQSGTALEIGTSGDTITVPSGATLDISASTLTPPATLPASSGVNLTDLNATNLGSGTVPTARLGTGTASSSTVLYGDQTYKAEPTGGKILQVKNLLITAALTTTTTSWAEIMSLEITPAATDSTILVEVGINNVSSSGSALVGFKLFRDATAISACTTAGWATTNSAFYVAGGDAQTRDQNSGSTSIIDTPATTSTVDYSIQWANETSGQTWYMNRWGTNADAGSVSFITLTEIGA